MHMHIFLCFLMSLCIQRIAYATVEFHVVALQFQANIQILYAYVYIYIYPYFFTYMCWYEYV